MASKENEISILTEHYTLGRQDMERRKLRKNGWDDILRNFFGRLPANWPYLSRLVDPVIRTALTEKNSRLLNGKLRGTLIPREGGDVIGAKVNNAILDYQWDRANNDGPMLDKWSLMDFQTRLFGGSFGLVYWDAEKESNDFKVLDNRNVFPDYQASDIRNANWVQVREWVSMDDLEKMNEGLPKSMKYKLSDLKTILGSDPVMGNRRNTEYTSQIKIAHGIEDQIGSDRANPVFELVTEYREDRWITFAPKHGNVIVRDIDSPRDDKKIPIVMLRYYFVGDDIYGDSEIEPVLPLARGINAVLSSFMDHTAITLRPPVIVANNATTRIDTFVYGPNALWLAGDSVENVKTHQTGTNQVISSFQSSYSVLKSALNTALGETSQDTSNIDPFGSDKTATEVRSSDQQKFTRDQRNQMSLEQALKDQMGLWYGNNKQFLFSDPTKQVIVQRIVGRETIKEFEALGLGGMETSDEAITEIMELIKLRGEDMTDTELSLMSEMTQVPTNPVFMNPDEKNPEKFDIRPKLELDEGGSFASLNIEPGDLDGVYDYIPSVKSMAANESEQQIAGRGRSLALLLNPSIGQQLAAVGRRVNVEDALIEVLEDNGTKDPEKLFEDIQQPQQPIGPQGTPQPMGMQPPGAEVSAPASGTLG